MQAHRILHSMGLVTATLCTAVSLAEGAESAKIRVLLVTGDDVAPAHDWQQIASCTREVLEAAGRFEVRVSEDAAILDSREGLDRYDAVVLTLFNRRTPTLSDGAKENLAAFVRGGKGFYVQHLASASFKEWGEFGKLCGRTWVMGKSGHGPRTPFQVVIAAKEHPITRGMSDFTADDELYAKLQGDADIEVLVTADSGWSGATEPLLFTTQYGEGRCVHNAFGHDRKAILTPEVARLIVRSVEWAATGAVTD